MIQTYKARLHKKTQVSSETWVFRFELTQGAPLTFVPGQYLILFVPQGQTQARRLFSISTPPSEGNEFELLVKLIPGGAASEYLHHLAPTEEVTFQGPAGMFYLRERGKNIIFMATGTGLAPIRSILLATLEKLSSPVYLFWGLRTSQDAYYLQEFESLKRKNPHFSYTLCFSRDQEFLAVDESLRNYCRTGRVPQVIDTMTQGGELMVDNSSDYYLCGGRGAVDTFREYLGGKGVERGNIFFEKF